MEACLHSHWVEVKLQHDFVTACQLLPDLVHKSTFRQFHQTFMPQGWITKWEVLTKIVFLSKHTSQNLGELYAEKKLILEGGTFFSFSHMPMSICHT